ncbi:MAG: EF-hand domain-containing protein, partial [Candidatus Thioglobus sp.]
MNLKKLFAVALISSVAFSVNAAGFKDSVGGEADVFSVFDSNNDGKISMTEMVEAMVKIASMDRDGDPLSAPDAIWA